MSIVYKDKRIDDIDFYRLSLLAVEDIRVISYAVFFKNKAYLRIYEKKITLNMVVAEYDRLG